MGVALRMVLQDHVACFPRVRIPQVRLESTLPVRMAQRRGARRAHQLARHEEVVRDGVGGEVREIPESKRAERIGGREVEDLLAHVPRVTVASHGRVLLRDRGVGGDVAVQEIVRECA